MNVPGSLNTMMMGSGGGNAPPAGFAYLLGNTVEEIWGTNDFASFTRVHNTPASGDRSYYNLTTDGAGSVVAAFGLSASVFNMYTSSDSGATWSISATGLSGNTQASAIGAFNQSSGTLWVPDGSIGRANRSSDLGTSWTQQSVNLSSGAVGFSMLFYASGQGRFYAFTSSGENRYSHSINETTWTRVIPLGALQSGGVYSPWANLLFTVDTAGAVYSYNPTRTLVGNCGITSGGITVNPNPMACNPLTGRLLVAGAGGSCRTSDDNGATWTARTYPSFTPWAARWLVSLGAFVVVGNGGNIATSPDGITWTSIVDASLGDLRSICGTQDMTT